MNEETEAVCGAVVAPVEPTVRRHTPGPWAWRGTLGPHNAEHLKGPCVVEIAATGTQLAILRGWRTDQQKADAALMAAAPDMANALRSLLRHAERVNEVLGQECGVRFVDTGPLDMARDALKRAVGDA